MVLATEAMDMVSATDMEAMDITTARGRPRLRPSQRLTLTFFMEATTEDLDIIMEPTAATLTTATMARDLLTLSPLWSLPLSATPTLPTPMLPLPLSLPPSPSPTRP